MDNGKIEPAPQSVIYLHADLGMSTFEITTENCNALQLFGAAEVLRCLGMEAMADERAAAMLPRIAPQDHRPKLVTAKRLPS
jgi:hypothetical protein